MSSTVVQESKPAEIEGWATLQLTSAYGPVFRSVKTTPPRNATREEIPVIDVNGIFSKDIEDRKAVAAQIRQAATTIGFFYMKNHGIPQDTIASALKASKTFFHQPQETKERVSVSGSKWHNGWNGPKSHRANAVENGFRAEECCWNETSNVPGFKEAVIEYWRACLSTARRLVRTFALALDLPEDHFDTMTSHPDAAIALNYYPPIPQSALEDKEEAVSIGSHTDLQFFTMLWQDQNGGLQVLNRDGQWLNATPIEGTFVLNIGDYLMRITNDRFVSTVHRAKNFNTNERFSMPFFFGFNFNETCGVLPSCVDEDHPAKYEPISCQEWVHLRFKATNI